MLGAKHVAVSIKVIGISRLLKWYDRRNKITIHVLAVDSIYITHSDNININGGKALAVTQLRAWGGECMVIHSTQQSVNGNF